LLKTVIQGVSLPHFHVYMYYVPNWFISFVFLLSTLVIFLWLFPQVLKCYVHSFTKSISTTFTFLTSFFCPPSPVSDLLIAWPVFHNIACVRPIFHIIEFRMILWMTKIILKVIYPLEIKFTILHMILTLNSWGWENFSYYEFSNVLMHNLTSFLRDKWHITYYLFLNKGMDKKRFKCGDYFLNNLYPKTVTLHGTIP
jgi:hypothetical protein